MDPDNPEFSCEVNKGGPIIVPTRKEIQVQNMTSNSMNQTIKIFMRSRNLEEESMKLEKFLKDSWKFLEHGLNAIFHKQNDDYISLEQLYSEAYNMVILGQVTRLYMVSVTIMTSHVKEISKSIEEAAEGDFFLEELSRKWNDYKMAIQNIENILIYMDRTYVRKNDKTPIRDLGLNLWRDNVVYSAQIQSQLQNTLVELLHGERIGKVINNKDLIRNTFMMLKYLGDSDYETSLEIRFLEVSAEYFRGESQKLIECCDFSDYIRKVKNHLIEEMIRVSHYSDFICGKKIVDVMCKEMIENRIESSWLVTFFLDDRYEDLRNVYMMFTHYVSDGLRKLQKVVRNTCQLFLTDPERLKDPMVFVQDLLDKKDKYDSILDSSFNNDEKCHAVLNSFFEYIINMNLHSPEFLSLFLDVKLRKGFEGVNAEIILDKVVALIRLLHEKDMFLKYYKKHLAKRLLLGKTVSKDAERSLVVKLKRVCGNQFVVLEKMIVDMETSEEMLQGFYKSHTEVSDDRKLSVQVLTTSLWPISSTTHSSCNLPIEVSALYEKYKSYYLGIHTQKKLSWQVNMGNAEIIATFGSGHKHELHVSTYQMCVLMLFNDVDQLSYKDIAKATQINTLDLIKCLYSMVLVKGKNIIKKEPMNGHIGEDDVFFINDMFKSKFYKIKLDSVAAERESKHEKLQTQKNVEDDRRPQIDAAIMRIMKSRKQLDHNNIIAEVTKEVKSLFLPNPTEIKKRIESLIERDYLERDNIDNNLYRYLA
ncbi:unnamed protein product [Trifolium pratense]|uniref:Uncharacterized protein n=1 Tax=Trifolium pratense TaxID=57577 RepID=A0ACB0JSY3_TRIPR|nr:unnamed protein product [Trifolium pratense]